MRRYIKKHFTIVSIITTMRNYVHILWGDVLLPVDD